MFQREKRMVRQKNVRTVISSVRVSKLIKIKYMSFVLWRILCPYTIIAILITSYCILCLTVRLGTHVPNSDSFLFFGGANFFYAQHSRVSISPNNPILLWMTCKNFKYFFGVRSKSVICITNERYAESTAVPSISEFEEFKPNLTKISDRRTRVRIINSATVCGTQ